MRIPHLRVLPSLVLAWGALGSAVLAATPGYLRQPDIHGDQIVFAAEGDLWTASVQGGVARRLTSHPGSESYPAFSPDGKWIAFTGEYDGNADVYVVPAQGGEPRRMTWHPYPEAVIGWSPDGTRILFRSGAEEAHGVSEMYALPLAGGEPEKLPLGWAARLAIDSKTGMWAFTRISTETRTWKRYRGGENSDIWCGSPEKADFRKVTEFPGTSAYPMWHDGRIFFLSDQGGTANLWSMKPDGSDRKQLTDLGTWDARTPSMGPDGRIVFVLAGDVHLYDPKAGKEKKLDIELPSDRFLTRVRYPDAEQYLTTFDLSPDGERVAVVTRGEIFSVPVKKGATLPVTRGSGAREKWASFSGDGKRIAFVTDEPKEEEIRTIDAWGRGGAKVVKPAAEKGWYFPPAYSPDGSWIAYSDETQTLFVAPAGGGSPKKVDHSDQSEIRSYAWSPDGRFLAYHKDSRTDYSSVYIYDTKSAQTHRVTGPFTNDYGPAWDPDGRYLYFLGDRTTNPLIGNRDFENVEFKSTKPYLVLLRKDVDNPLAHLAGLPPKDGDKKDKEKDKDEAKDKKKGDAKDEKKDDKDKKPKPVEIDFDGLPDRVVELPVDAGNYYGLSATSKKVFYIAAKLHGMAEGPGLFQEAPPDATLMAFDLEKKEAATFLDGVSAYAIAAEPGKIAVMKRRGEIYVVDTSGPPGDKMGDAKLDLSGIVIDLDPREEWAQIYYEAWRQMRDFYWDPMLAGQDWKAIRDQYATMLPRLATRGDLQDLIGELIGEMNTSHTYVFGGDPGGMGGPRVPTGLLGADVKRDGDGFRVTRIYRGDPADNERSPLAEPGVDVREGDLVTAVNHVAFPAGRPFLASLEGLAGKDVVLTVRGGEGRPGERDVVVRPAMEDSHLRYVDWVRRNREYVAEKTGGKIGYVHLPNMWTDGLVAFNTWFYPQLDKEGMVIDVRWNGGGAVSQMIIERLRRSILSFDRARGGGVTSYPYRALNGPFVVVTNEFAGSDGDIFPRAVQLAGLAPVIGKRSWGGVVGIRGDKQLVDGGMVTQPEFAWWEPAKGWALENHGVDPDIDVQNLPQDVAKGVDTQLDRAIQEVLSLREKHPPIKPDFGPVNPKSRDAYKKELATN